MRARVGVVAFFDPACFGIVPGGHLGQCVLVVLAALVELALGWTRRGTVEPRNLCTPVGVGWRRRRLVGVVLGDIRHGRRRLVVIWRWLIHILVALSAAVRRRTAAGDTSTASCAALDSTADTVDDAGQNGDDNHRSHNDSDNHRPFAVRLGHTLVPTGECLRSRFNVIDSIACPQLHRRFQIHRTHFCSSPSLSSYFLLFIFFLSRAHTSYIKVDLKSSGRK